MVPGIVIAEFHFMKTAYSGWKETLDHSPFDQIYDDLEDMDKEGLECKHQSLDNGAYRIENRITFWAA